MSARMPHGAMYIHRVMIDVPNILYVQFLICTIQIRDVGSSYRYNTNRRRWMHLIRTIQARVGGSIFSVQYKHPSVDPSYTYNTNRRRWIHRMHTIQTDVGGSIVYIQYKHASVDPSYTYIQAPVGGSISYTYNTNTRRWIYILYIEYKHASLDPSYTYNTSTRHWIHLICTIQARVGGCILYVQYKHASVDASFILELHHIIMCDMYIPFCMGSSHKPNISYPSVPPTIQQHSISV
jgi:hypothetical protein